MSFDIVIPLGPNERKNIHRQIEHTKKNVIGYRNIYIVTNNYDNLQIDGCKIINEDTFPFKMNDIASYFIQHNGKCNRNGWYFQQLLKLYVGFIIKELLDNYLIIDADVFFLKPTEFYINSKYVFTISDENHEPYFKHMEKIHPTFTKQINSSGISHHMLFNKQIIKEIFELVENFHHKPFWVVFIEMVDEHKNYSIHAIESGASEYELYFNYMIQKHKDSIIIRKLDWSNKPYDYNINNPCDLDYLSICSWMK
jgi:L-rhamnose mutarotase